MNLRTFEFNKAFDNSWKIMFRKIYEILEPVFSVKTNQKRISGSWKENEVASDSLCKC